MATEPPLVVIVGPTASGKTRLAIRLAKQFEGEIISADSRAVYRGLDIGTAKPSAEEQREVPHWGIDIVNPDQRFTAADFQRYAFGMIGAIRARGNIPFLVGGTGLYVDSVLYAYQFSSGVDDLDRREMLMGLDLDALHVYCRENNIELPENNKNKRYVVNNILRNGAAPMGRGAQLSNAIVVGIATEKSVLHSHIEHRANGIFASGVIAEAKSIADEYGWTSEAMTGNIYPLVHDYLDGLMTEDELKQKFIVQDRRLAKRQNTWFRRNEHIMWLDADSAYTYIAQVLDAYSNS